MSFGQSFERGRFPRIAASCPIVLICGVVLLLRTASHAADAAAPSPYRIAYDNGVVVEVLAVSMVPSRGKPFWQPDGARLIDAPYESRDPGYGRNPGNSTYEIVARVTGGKDKPIYMTPRAANGISVGYGAVPYQGGKTLEDLRVFECSAPPGADELEFELGIAANTWQTGRAFKTLGVYGEGPGKMEVVDAQDWEKKSKP